MPGCIDSWLDYVFYLTGRNYGTLYTARYMCSYGRQSDWGIRPAFWLTNIEEYDGSLVIHFNGAPKSFSQTVARVQYIRSFMWWGTMRKVNEFRTSAGPWKAFCPKTFHHFQWFNSSWTIKNLQTYVWKLLHSLMHNTQLILPYSSEQMRLIYWE